jgi:translation elongation factor EF-1beta
MTELEVNVRKIEMDGLVWGQSKFVPVGYGIKMLQINLVIEDDKVSLDDLQEKIEEDKDHVQSTDIVSFLILSSRKAKSLISRPGCHAEAVGLEWLLILSPRTTLPYCHVWSAW